MLLQACYLADYNRIVNDYRKLNYFTKNIYGRDVSGLCLPCVVNNYMSNNVNINLKILLKKYDTVFRRN